MAQMIALGVEFWNDSSDVRELEDAVAQGAVGATSNPAIVTGVLRCDRERWIPHLRRIEREWPGLPDEALAARWVEAMIVEASRVLLPVFERTHGEHGILNTQVSPLLAHDARAMLEQGRALAALAPNLAVKIPLTEAGLDAIEALASEGIRTNATVSFSVSQALAAAEAMERGMRRAGRPFPSYVTIMVGRVADHVRRVQEAEKIPLDAGVADWAGIAVMKKAHRLFRERGLGPTLVAAAYRHRRQWTELVGPRIVQSIPHAWWKAFDASDVTLARTIDLPVPDAVREELVRFVPDFVRAYEEDGMQAHEFARYGASVATLAQFEAGHRELVRLVREVRS
jgi:transaldolase